MHSARKILGVQLSDEERAQLDAALDAVVAQASSVDDAVKVAGTYSADLIVVATDNTDQDLEEMCGRIRRETGIPRVKILLCLPSTVKVAATGADGVVTRPLDPIELGSWVQTLLELKRVEDSDHLKTNLIRLLNQEFRTPLSGVMTGLELMHSDREMDAESREILIKGGLQGCEELWKLLEHATLLCKLRAGEVDLGHEEVHVGELLKEVVDSQSWSARQSRLSIQLGIPETTTVQGDPGLLRTVFEAVLKNAIRYSKPRGEVLFDVTEEESFAVLTVTHTGPHGGYTPGGLLAEYADHDLSRHAVGKGLDLAIGEEVVLYHGGRMKLESTSQKKTTLSIRLPLQRQVELA